MLAELGRLAMRLDPSTILDELGFEPDPWQRGLLRTRSMRVLLNIHRQAGKSTAAAALALATALFEPGSLSLVVSPSLRQSSELFLKIGDFHRDLGALPRAVEDNARVLSLENQSRIICLPDSDATVRGYSAPTLIIADEASRLSDATYVAILPMLIQSAGRLVAMSTPFGRRGWWSDCWHDGGPDWERVELPADRNPRVAPAALEQQRRELGPRFFAQEFLCAFVDSIGQVFDSESVEAAFNPDVVPLFGAAS